MAVQEYEVVKELRDCNSLAPKILPRLIGYYSLVRVLTSRIAVGIATSFPS